MLRGGGQCAPSRKSKPGATGANRKNSTTYRRLSQSIDAFLHHQPLNCCVRGSSASQPLPIASNVRENSTLASGGHQPTGVLFDRVWMFVVMSDAGSVDGSRGIFRLDGLCPHGWRVSAPDRVTTTQSGRGGTGRRARLRA